MFFFITFFSIASSKFYVHGHKINMLTLIIFFPASYLNIFFIESSTLLIF